MKIKQTLIDIVVQYPKEKENEQALVFLDGKGAVHQEYTFGSLEKTCRNVAQNLWVASMKKEKVLLAVEDQSSFVVGFFGCLMAGKIPAPVPAFKFKKNRPGWGRAQEIIKKGEVDAVMIEEGDYKQVAEYIQTNNLGHIKIYVIELLKTPNNLDLSLPKISPADTAYIQFTSGSTSVPKGIVLTHGQVIANMERMYRVFDRGERVRVAGWIPFYHDMGLVGHLFTVLFEAGFGVFLSPASFLTNPYLWLEAIGKYNANSAAAPTFAFEHCCRKEGDIGALDLSGWKNVYVGSETVSWKILKSFHAKFSSTGFEMNSFRPVYGLAEVTLLAAGGQSGLADLEENIYEKGAGSKSTRKLIPYGIDPSTKVTIHQTETLELVADGMEGEIWIESDSNYLGYLEKENENGGSESQIVKTGDLGFLKGGFLYLTGRKKETIILRGVNYSAEDLELCARLQQPLLRSHDKTACVSEIMEEGEQLYVFQEAYRHLNQTDFKQISDIIQANLSENFGILAASVIIIPQGFLPKTSNYKIARNKCIDLYSKGQLSVLYNMGETETVSLSPQKVEEEVVIVGMACRFPGGGGYVGKILGIIGKWSGCY